MSKVIGIIPARMASWRFPGKPLCDICGVTMIEHVYKRSAMSKSLDEVYIATCDKEIEEAANAFGAKVIMTPDTFNRCTDRVTYAIEKIKTDADIVVLIQGDEPLLHPDMIDDVVAPLLEDQSIVCSCMMAKVKSDNEFDDPNEVKLVKDVNNFILYLSREPIPSRKLSMKPFDRYKQVCIMPYRKDFLFKFSKMKQTPLEIVESIDMLRILENGYKIKVVESFTETYSVDVEADRQKVISVMKNDPLFRKYGKYLDKKYA